MRKFNLPLKTLALFLVIIFPLILPSGNQKDFFENVSLFPKRDLFPGNIRAEALKTEPLDFLFLGGSIIEDSIQGKILEEHLSTPQKKFRVYSATLGGGAADVYTQYRTLDYFLKTRKVKVVFLSSEVLLLVPSLVTALDFNHDALYPAFHEMTWNEIANLAGFAILSSPRRLRQWLSPVTSKQTAASKERSANQILERGSYPRSVGYDEGPFIKRTYAVPTLNIDTLTSEPDKNHDFFAANSFENYYLAEIVRLCQEYQVRLFIMASPHFTKDLLPQENMQFPVTYIEAPPAELFKGLNREEIRGLFLNSSHLNTQGGKLHTEAMLPFFRKIAEDLP